MGYLINSKITMWMKSEFQTHVFKHPLACLLAPS